ncbi:MAG: VWA domain-containing protein [Spirochaetales bacterium]|nr:VWA domain-containing protein [Spirochaetales bacterium]
MISKNLKQKCAIIILFIAVLAAHGWAQSHDLVMQQAPDITSMIISNCKSPDIQLEAPFGSAGTDTILHGRTNRIFARFFVNGMLDPIIPATPPVTIEFHARPAFPGETPPDNSDPSWGSPIGTIYVDGMHTPPDIYLGPGSFWPDEYLSATNLSIDWTAPATGDYFHILAEVMYPPGYTDEYPENNYAISLYEAITQPHKIDLVLVHDVSGSMLYNTYNSTPYIDLAKEMVIPMVASMPESDRMAIVAYGGCLPGGVADIFPATPGTLAAMNQTNKDLAIDAIDLDITVPATYCSTPMGDGLQRAIDILNANADLDSKKIIILMSDGEENSGAVRACSHTAFPPCAFSPILSQLQAGNIQVFTVALGPAGWIDCLECLGTSSDGGWYDSYNPGVDLLDVYLDAQQAYEDDDLYKRDISNIGDTSDSYEVYFEGVDNVLYFILGWENLNTEMKLILTSPSGNRIKMKTYNGKGYIVHQVMNPEKGLWKYRVEGPRGERYLAAVRSNKVDVRMSLDVDDSGIVNRPLYVKIGLSNTLPKKAKVVATADVPYKQSIDTAISMAVRDFILQYKVLPVTAEDLKRNPDQSAKSIFVNKILKGGSILDNLIKRQTVEIPLELNSDGAFVGKLSKEIQIAGKYVVTAKGSGEVFDRVYARTILLKPDKVDSRQSYAEVLPLDPKLSKYPQYVLRVYCRDQYTNLVTSDELIKRLSVKLYDCKPVDRFGLAFDCTYQQIIQSEPGVPVKVAVTLDGKELPVEYYTGK